MKANVTSAPPPRAPAAMAGPRRRIDMSTPPCQQPLAHNLTWKRVESHPHGRRGWRMQRRVRACAAQTPGLRSRGTRSMRNGFDSGKKKKKKKKDLQKEGSRNFSICGQEICSDPMETKSQLGSSMKCTNKFKFVQEWDEKLAAQPLHFKEFYMPPPSPQPTVQRSGSARWQQKTLKPATLVPACFKYSPTVCEPDPEPSRRYQIHIIRSPFPPGCPCCPAPSKAETGAKKKKNFRCARRVRVCASELGPLCFPQKCTHIGRQSADGESHLKAEEA